ncbi:MAG: hypothetical protein JW958_06465 [Candidatus Eisenbacteria bacterium]|nr:hypothetical protein [Candidatus Eisenbacteria bacterium]
MKRAASAALLAALLLTAGCAPPARDAAPVARDGAATEKLLERLRERIEAVRSFRCEGTMLLETETEKHFIHFQARYRRPDRLRVDLDVGGPLGLGSGRLTVAERGDTLEALLPDEEFPRRGLIGDPSFAFLDETGLGFGDAAYLIAPFTGRPDLFTPHRLLASARDGRTGAERLVLQRDDGNREVLIADPAAGRLLERRVTRPGGEVLLICFYGDEKGGGDPFPEETECRIPRKRTILRTRYGSTTLNPDLPDRIFRADHLLP